MIQFNKLEVDPDAGWLMIDVSVIEMPYFENVFLDEIIIDTQDTYVENGPSTNPVYRYKVTGPTDIKQSQVMLTGNNLQVPINDTMFFVYVKTKGTPAINTPCGMDKSIGVGVTYNTKVIYNDTMNYLKQLECSCTMPKDFIDKILRVKALETTIKTGNYTQAIQYYNRFFRDKYSPGYVKTCSCHG